MNAPKESILRLYSMLIKNRGTHPVAISLALILPFQLFWLSDWRPEIAPYTNALVALFLLALFVLGVFGLRYWAELNRAERASAVCFVTLSVGYAWTHFRWTDPYTEMRFVPSAFVLVGAICAIVAWWDNLKALSRRTVSYEERVRTLALSLAFSALIVGVAVWFRGSVVSFPEPLRFFIILVIVGAALRGLFIAAGLLLAVSPAARARFAAGGAPAEVLDPRGKRRRGLLALGLLLNIIVGIASFAALLDQSLTCTSWAPWGWCSSSMPVFAALVALALLSIGIAFVSESNQRKLREAAQFSTGREAGSR
ncbi:MAG: hypothetical protein GIW95_08220 [Candidatus Eremiobacteraeota bacterium]|nr:hypothetical protein [Candidatus Eremiobacteraeota bacterium]